MLDKIKYLVKRFGLTILAVAIILGTFWSGVYFGTWRTQTLAKAIPTIYNQDEGKPENVDFALFWKAWKVLDDKYVASHKNATTTSEDRLWGAIQGLANSYGDPYTVFFPPVESKEFQSEINGNFEGVGMEVGIRDGITTVIAPLKGTPAYKAGIKPGDKILKIDDKITSGMTVDEAVGLIRGKRGTTVRVTILRQSEDKPREISITRDIINIPTLDTEMRKDGIFVVRLYNFSAQSTQLFRNAMKEFSESKSDKIIIDLRGNPGGYLDAAVDMASWFLPAGEVVVRESSGKGNDQIFSSAGYSGISRKVKMIILIDGGSASASEILAGALQEHGVAKLVGTKTYGKGSVQELIPFTNSTSIKITVARWLTPNGNSISDQGLKPDYEVNFTAEDLAKVNDVQMSKAVELLLKK